MLPLLFDFNNPTPSIGFDLKERLSINDRGNVKCIMALALIHHICISNNVTFDMVASSFSGYGEYLIIEFVPKEDSKVQELLMTRKDIFDKYDQDNFESSFNKYFDIKEKYNIKGSKRIMYLMKRKIK